MPIIVLMCESEIIEMNDEWLEPSRLRRNGRKNQREIFIASQDIRVDEFRVQNNSWTPEN